MNQAENTAILSMGSLVIAFPQSDIVSVDVVADAKPGLSENLLTAASLHKQGEQWPVYALSDELKPQNHISDTCRFFACIKKDNMQYALACDAIELVKIKSDTPQQDLPYIMQANQSPITRLLNINNKVTLQANAESINHYLESLGVNNAEPK